MKTCTKCNETLPLDMFRAIFYKHLNKSYYKNSCNNCIRLYQKELYHRTPEDKIAIKIVREKQKQINADKRKAKTNIRSIAYYYKNKEAISMKSRTPEARAKRMATMSYGKNYTTREQKAALVNRLADCYIRDLLVVRNKALSAKDIPDSLVQLKRQELILKRKLRNHE